MADINKQYLDTEKRLINLFLRFQETIKEAIDLGITANDFDPKHRHLVQSIYYVFGLSNGKRTLTEEHYRSILVEQGSTGNLSVAMNLFFDCLVGAHYTNSENDFDLLIKDFKEAAVHKFGVIALHEFNENVAKLGYQKATKKYSEAMAEISSHFAPTTPLNVIRLDGVKAKPIEWLWPNHIPLGKLTVFMGDGGIGKSFMTCELAAIVSSNRQFPDNCHVGESGDVLFLACEDGVEDTIVPRLIEAGAEMSKVKVLESANVNGIPDAMISLTRDLGAIEHYFKSNPQIRLLVIDPIQTYLGGKVDSHKDADVRQCLSPLLKLAEKYRVAIVGLLHLNKDRKTKAIYRGTGANAFVTLARTVWLFARDPEDETEERVLFLRVKGNLSKDPGGLAFKLEAHKDIAKIVWDGCTDLTADEALAKGETKEKPKDEAKTWMLEFLSDGEKESKVMWQKAELFGISERTLKRAHKELKSENKIECYQRAKNDWVWRLKEPITKEEPKVSWTLKTEDIQFDW